MLAAQTSDARHLGGCIHKIRVHTENHAVPGHLALAGDLARANIKGKHMIADMLQKLAHKPYLTKTFHNKMNSSNKVLY